MKFLVSVLHPAGYDGSKEGPEMAKAIDDLNDAMVAAGVRVFVGGLHPIATAKSVSKDPSGKVVVTDGPHIETKESIGGFWVLECASFDDAIEWAKQATVACQVPIEVRQFH